jgi:hypothetical protein
MSLHAKAHTFASRAQDQAQTKSCKECAFRQPQIIEVAKAYTTPMKTSNMRVNSFFSFLPSVFYFFAHPQPTQKRWTETAITHTGPRLDNDGGQSQLVTACMWQ